MMVTIVTKIAANPLDNQPANLKVLNLYFIAQFMHSIWLTVPIIH